MPELILTFIPTPAQRKENKRKNKEIELQTKNGQRQTFDRSSKRKVRFGSLTFIPPTKDKTAKTFIVYLESPLPWKIIVTRVTQALEDLL